MSDAPSFLIADLAQRLNARTRGDDRVAIRGLAAIDDAHAGDLTFIADKRYAQRWSASAASAAVVLEGLDLADADRPLLFVPDVELAMIALLTLFLPPEDLPDPGVHPSAVVHPSAKIARDARIGPHVSVGPGAVVGERAALHPGVRLYADVVVGEASVLHANTVVRERCILGRRVILHQNVSIGADGFGYRPAPDGKSGGGLLKMPHIGNVVIQDDVEIGPGVCVDRGKFGSTVIGAGTKIDNLCQIGHNARIGRACVIVSGTGVSGSVVIGDGCMISGHVAIAPHVAIGPGAKVAAQSGVMNDVPAGAAVAGAPATSARAAMREAAALRRLPELLRRLTPLIEKIEQDHTDEKT